MRRHDEIKWLGILPEDLYEKLQSRFTELGIARFQKSEYFPLVTVEDYVRLMQILIKKVN